jgi:hypothetical protein
MYPLPQNDNLGGVSACAANHKTRDHGSGDACSKIAPSTRDVGGMGGERTRDGLAQLFNFKNKTNNFFRRLFRIRINKRWQWRLLVVVGTGAKLGSRLLSGHWSPGMIIDDVHLTGRYMMLLQRHAVHTCLQLRNASKTRWSVVWKPSVNGSALLFVITNFGVTRETTTTTTSALHVPNNSSNNNNISKQHAVTQPWTRITCLSHKAHVSSTFQLPQPFLYVLAPTLRGLFFVRMSRRLEQLGIHQLFFSFLASSLVFWNYGTMEQSTVQLPDSCCGFPRSRRKDV